MKKLLFSLSVIGMIAATACQKEIDFKIDDRDTFIIKINGDTNFISVKVDGDRITIKGDSIVNNNRVYGGDVNVNGGDVNNTNTNVNNGGSYNGNGNEEDLDGFELLVIPTSEFIQSVHYEVALHETDDSPAEFIYQDPALDSYALAYYDGTRANVTTSAFPLSIPRHKDPIEKKTYVSAWTKGVFGAKDDKDKPLYALNIYNEGSVASVDSIGTWNDGLLERRLSGDCYLVGFHASDGNNPGDHTGRIVIGTDGRDIYILRGFKKTTEETYKMFKRLDLPFEGVTISGGSTAASAKHNIIAYKARYYDYQKLRDFVR